ncbi:MAG: porin family protein [Lutibacter sp.]|uniref:porin family protein n=1 Tax=Lutibacter sp. TaxID=1925666 RepID=UPI00299E170B|nr:porin family protein [Lutibacter sp.]MDX1830441.1 porin family protein [Lutibacter sp.]
MKKIFLIITIAFFSITTITAQKKINFGVKGGFNFSNITQGVYSGYTSSKTGMNIGLLAEIPLSDKFAIQPEILYSTQGAKTSIILNSLTFPGAPPIPAEYKLNYIQIPVLAKVNIINSLSFEIGPQFSFLTKAEEKSSLGTTSNIGNHFEFGGVLGISYKINKTIFLNSRYLKGFSKAFKNNGEAKNFGFQLGIGILF